MKRLFLAVLLVVCAFGHDVIAQSISGLPTDGKFVAYRPEVLLKNPLPDVSELRGLTVKPYGQTGTTRKKIWCVYSDRDNNVLYSDSKGSNRLKTVLSLGEIVVIAKIDQSTGYALVYTNVGGDDDLSIGERKPKGWIKMDNLLLWSDASCQFSIANKAVLCANTKYKQNPETLLKCFSAPYGDHTLEENITNGFIFYYVMKTVGNRTLLSKRQHIGKSGVCSNDLYGWVDKNSYIPWNQRTCFEPEWHDKKVANLRGTNLTNYTFISGDWIYRVPFSGEREAPQMLRYPIFDDSTSETLHCSYFEAPNGFDLVEYNRAKQNLEAMLKKFSTAHIGIVIDGTKSMGPYFQSAKEALLKGCSYLGGEFKSTIDVMIYRDDKDGKYITEYKTGFKDPKTPALRQFLDNAGEYGAVSSKFDTDMEESLYYGLSTALEVFKFNPNQANLLIIIGDCGDNERPMKINSEQLVSTIVASNVNVVGVQVRNTAGKPFQDFQAEVIDLVYESIAGRYKKTLGRGGIIKSIAVPDGFDWNTGYDLFFGCYRGAEVGKTFDTSKATDVLKAIFFDWSTAISKYKNDLQDLKLGNPSANNQNNEIMKSQIGEVAFKSLCSAGGFAAIDATTARKRANFDLYAYTLMLDRSEYTEVLKRLKPVYDASIKGDASSETRSKYVDAMKALVLALTGGSTKDIGKMTNEDIMKMLFGVNIKRPGIAAYPLEEIIDKKKVSDDEFLELAMRLENSYNQLNKYYKSTDCKINLGGNNTIFWVPLEYIP